MIGQDLATMGIPILEKVVRTIAVYGGLAVLLRVAGKRDLAQLNTFDLVVMLLLSNVVQNAVIGNDNSLTGGLIGAAVLVAVNSLVVRAAARNDVMNRAFEGTPTVLVRNGRYDESALRREGLRRADVEVALRRQGGAGADDVAELTLEPGGALVVHLQPEQQPATKADVASLAHRIQELAQKLDALRAR